MANDLGSWRAAGFSGQLNGKSIGHQTQRQHRCLGGLARPFAALKSDESASHARNLSTFFITTTSLFYNYNGPIPYKISALPEFSTATSEGGHRRQQI